MAFQDGIEIHFNEKSGYLQLDCEPDAFAAYLELARKDLQGFPDVSLDKVREIYIIKIPADATQLGPQPRGIRQLMFFSIVFIILGLAVSGAISLIGKLLK